MRPAGWASSLQWWLLIQVAGAAHGKAKDCRHGTFDADTKACVCDEGWGTAGITDTVDFLEGICEQYHCKSDDVCQSILPAGEAASCPVRGWNCYCGWAWAFSNYGHGYENAEAECMGVMYTFSVSMTYLIERLMTTLWKVFLVLAVLLLPFGRKRAICDHHNPSLWNGLRRCCGCQPDCRGECVMSTVYGLDSLKDDLAWTLYALDVGVWVYLFLSVFYLTMLFVWSAVLWLMVIAIIVVLALAQCIFCGGAECCCCCEGGCDLTGGCPIDCCAFGGTDMAANDGAGLFFWSGAFPNTPYYLDPSLGTWSTTSDDNCCSCCCSYQILKPLAWLIYVFPGLPENAWGGLCGYYVFGTHHLTPQDRIYAGGSPTIELFRMGWRRPNDLHGNEDWRQRVREFLDDDAQGPGRSGYGRTHQNGFSSMDVEETRFLSPDVLVVGHGRAKLIHRPFDEEGDGCFPSSFEDYKNNECWICKDSKDTWDLWISCKHLFCKDCSTEMLRRRMPCPLCRVSSAVVLRGHAHSMSPQSPVQARQAGAGAAGSGAPPL